LAAHGRELWDRIWSAGRRWISPDVDVELVLMVCEQVDERVRLRDRVLKAATSEERRALRELERAVVQNLSLLGFTPTDRARLGVAEVTVRSKLEELRSRASR